MIWDKYDTYNCKLLTSYDIICLHGTVSSSKYEYMEHKSQARAQGKPQYLHSDRSISRKNAPKHLKKRKRFI